MSYGYSRMKKLKKRASYRYQYMPNLNEMEFKDYHQLAVRFCQENNIRTIQDCITYYGMRTKPEMYECTWEQYIENNKEEK